MDLDKPGTRIGDKLRPLEAQAQIECGVGEGKREGGFAMPLHVDFPLGGYLARHLDHTRIVVQARHAATGHDPRHRQTGAGAGATGDVQDRLSRGRRGNVDDSLRPGSEHFGDEMFLIGRRGRGVDALRAA